jgi:ubiquinone/menaquinone biosynthesis C-methylase UbiE
MPSGSPPLAPTEPARSLAAHCPLPLRVRLSNALNRALFEVGAHFYGWQTWQPTWRAHCADMADHFPAAASGAPPLRVLDLGIGPGISGIGILDRRPEVAVVGLDFSRTMLRLAKGYLRRASMDFPLVRADVARLPFSDDSFDVLTHHSFLYLLSQKDLALDQMFRVLRPGGRYVLLEPNRDGDIRNVRKLRGELRFRLSMFLWRVLSRGYGQFTRASLTALLAAHGFVDIKVEETLNGLGLLAVASKPERSPGA